MAFRVPSYDAIRDAILRDLRAQEPDTDIGSDSDHYVRAAATAAAIEGIHQHQMWIQRQIFPDTADPDWLERHAAVRNIRRRRPVVAASSIRITGEGGTALAAGSMGLHRQSGETLTTAEDATIDASGTAEVPVVATTPGVALNGLSGELTLNDPPLGIDAKAVLVTPLAGGVDEESDAELLDRLLELIRRPPAGGNRYDYRRWALEVDGVSNAYVYPLRRGLGTVDVVITSAGGLPSEQTLAAAQAHIDEMRPVTAKHSLVMPPELLAVDVSVLLDIDTDVTTLTTATAQVKGALAEYFATLAPGDVVYRWRIETVISGIAGIVDRHVAAPAANVIPDTTSETVEWARLGQVSVERMS